MGTVSLLDCDTRRAGQWGLAQLFLEEPVTAVWGQPFVAPRLVGRRTRSAAGRCCSRSREGPPAAPRDAGARSSSSGPATPSERALTVAWFGGFGGFTAADLVRGANVAPGRRRTRSSTGCAAQGQLVELAVGPARQLLLHADMVSELEERILRRPRPAARRSSR